MTILGRGDLSPRRRRPRFGRALVAVVVIALIAAGGYAGYRHFHASSSSPAAAPAPCRTTTPRVSVPSTAGTRVVVRNATLRTGLAARVAHALRQRHLTVTSVGNAAQMGKGVATVRYTSDRSSAARVVAAQIAGATLAPMSGSGRVELDIGPHYRGLRPAKAAHTALVVAAKAAVPSAVPAPTASCAGSPG